MEIEPQKPQEPTQQGLLPGIDPNELHGAVDRVMGQESLPPVEGVETQPVSPYDDPELLEKAAGNKRYLDRLVGVKITERMLAESPEDLGLQATSLMMQQALKDFEANEL